MTLVPAFLLVLATTPGAPPTKQLGQLYDRIASDLNAGRPLVVTLYVALCDNDTQGIVKVKNRRICQGDRPGENLYWAAAGGLSATLRKAGWRQVHIEHFADGDLAVKAIWRAHAPTSGALRERSVRGKVPIFIVGLGYRGSRIRAAMTDYLRAVNGDSEQREQAERVELRAGGASHLVGYIGHDYFYDIDDPRPLLALRNGDSVLHKGTFALSCTGDRLIRPAITRPNAHVLLLNRTLGFPGAWTAEAIARAVARGESARAIHLSAATAFADGQGISLAAAMGAFAYGDRTDRGSPLP